MSAKRLLTSKWLLLVAAFAVVALTAGTSFAGGHGRVYVYGSPGYAVCPPYVQTYPCSPYGYAPNYAPYYPPRVVVVPRPEFRQRFFVGNRGFEHRDFRGFHRR